MRSFTVWIELTSKSIRREVQSLKWRIRGNLELKSVKISSKAWFSAFSKENSALDSSTLIMISSLHTTDHKRLAEGVVCFPRKEKRELVSEVDDRVGPCSDHFGLSEAI